MPVIIQFFKDLSPLKLTIIGLGVLVALVIFIMYASKISHRDLAILYVDLDTDSSNKVINELENKKIPYEASQDGAVIKIPKDQVVKIRVSLAQSGIPHNGSMIGYEIFDKEDSIGTTNFTQNVKIVRALEGELSRTLTAFDQIEKARVHLVLPQKEIFAKERLEPRASIILKLRHGHMLNNAEVGAISHLIVTAVPGLDIKNITIVDFKGHSLKLGAQDEDSEVNAGSSEEYRISYENRLKKVIESLVEKTVGVGKIKAQVSVDMNFDRIVTNSETYDPDGAVIRSVQSMDEKERTPMGGGEDQDASVANNVPGGASGEAGGSNVATIEKSDQTTNYEISKTVKNHISEFGTVKKMSIGILVDGTYAANDKQEMVYSPRTKEELDKIVNLVKVAVGFSDDRNDKIEVINLQFSHDLDIAEPEDNLSWIREELPNLFQTLVFAIVVVLVLITVIRPITLKAFEIRKPSDEGAEAFMSAAVGGAQGGDHQMQNQLVNNEAGGGDPSGAEKQSSLENITRSVNDLVTVNPQDAVAVLRKWLNEGKQ